MTRPLRRQTVLDRLAQVKTILVGQKPAPMRTSDPARQDAARVQQKSISTAPRSLEIVREMLGPTFPIHVISAEHAPAWKTCATRSMPSSTSSRLHQAPRQAADMRSPFTCPIGSTVIEMASLYTAIRRQAQVGAHLGPGVHEWPGRRPRDVLQR